MKQLRQKIFSILFLSSLIVLISLTFIGCKSKKEEHSPRKPKPKYLVTIANPVEAPEKREPWEKPRKEEPPELVTYEISPTATSYERGAFLPGYAFSDGEKTYLFQVNSVHLPDVRNCKCERAQDGCTPDMDALQPTLKPKEGGDNLLADMEPKSGPNIYARHYLSSTISSAGNYVSISTCYKIFTCLAEQVVACKNRLYSTKGGLHEVSLEPFAALPAKRWVEGVENPVGSQGLIEDRIRMLPGDYPFQPELKRALKEGKEPKLAEVIFEEKHLVRRWIIDGFALYNRYRDRTVRSDDGWSSGTISLFDIVTLTPESTSPLIQEILYPRAVSAFSDDTGLKVVGWSNGTFTK